MIAFLRDWAHSLPVACWLLVAILDTLAGMWLARAQLTLRGVLKGLPRHGASLTLLIVAAIVQRFDPAGWSVSLANAQAGAQAGAAMRLQWLAIRPPVMSLLDNLRAMGVVPPDGPVGRRVPAGKPVPAESASKARRG